MPPKEAAIVCAHIFVSGKVQGVFYRKYTQLEASKLQLLGWVKNLDDGRVEIVAQGLLQNVKALEAWCHRGSPKAKVTSVQSEYTDELLQLGPFVVDR